MKNVALILSWRNLFRRATRTWITVAAIVFSNVLLMFMITLQFGSYDMMIDNSLKVFASHLQINRVDYDQNPKMRLAFDQGLGLAQQLRDGDPDLQIAARASAFVMVSSDSRSMGVQLAGVEPSQELTISSIPDGMIAGQYLADNDRNTAIIGDVLARNLQVELGDELTFLGSGFDGSFAASVVTVGGIFRSGMKDLDASLMQIPLAEFQSIFSLGDRVHSILLTSADINNTLVLQEQIKQALPALLPPSVANDLAVLNWREINPSIMQAIQSDIVSAIIMYSVLIILVVFSVINTQLMSTLERTREFGIMKSIGLSNRRLSYLLFIETALLAALGWILGIALGLVILVYFHYVGISFPGMDEMTAQFNMPNRMYPSLSPIALAIGPSAVFLGCLLGAVYPAIRLHRLEPIEAMRSA